MLDLLLEVLAAEGLVGAGGKQRTDSTHVTSAVRDLNRLELAGESVRACLEALAAAAPDWLATVIDISGVEHAVTGPGSIPGGCPPRRPSVSELATAYGSDALASAARDPCRGGPALAGASCPRWRSAPVLVQNYAITPTPRGGR